VNISRYSNKVSLPFYVFTEPSGLFGLPMFEIIENSECMEILSDSEVSAREYILLFSQYSWISVLENF